MRKWLWAVMLLAVAAGAAGQKANGKTAPVPLYRDPVHDGTADPTLIWNRARHEWWMFYTSRRADVAATSKGVEWEHGTPLGIAVSRDGGVTWTYHGDAAIPYGKPGYSFWAPDILYTNKTYHMFVTVVPGTFADWEHQHYIIHLTSPDLEHWKFVNEFHEYAKNGGDDRVIDPTLYQMGDGSWRMWYKDERDQSHIHYADSKDLTDWKIDGVAVTDEGSEAPNVFKWRGQYWMMTDTGHGLNVYSSSDLNTWTRQPGRVMAEPGKQPTDRNVGRHCDVVVSGDAAYIFYFTNLRGVDQDMSVPRGDAHSVLHVAVLTLTDGKLGVDRDSPVYIQLPKGGVPMK